MELIHDEPTAKIIKTKSTIICIYCTQYQKVDNTVVKIELNLRNNISKNYYRCTYCFSEFDLKDLTNYWNKKKKTDLPNKISNIFK